MKRILILALFLLVPGLASAATIGKVNSNNIGLVGWWTLDGSQTNWATGKTRDSAGTSTGTLINMSTTSSSVGGKVGQSLTFATSTYVDLGDVLNFNSLPITVSAWIQTNASVSGFPQGIFGTDPPTGTIQNHAGVLMSINTNGTLNVQYGDNTQCTASGRRTATSIATVPAGRWVHVVGVIRGPTDMSIYIDNVEAGEAYTGSGGTITSFTRTAKIGGLNDCGTPAAWNFNGKLDDVKVYTRALSAPEVAALYKSGFANVGQSVSGNIPNSRGLVDYWTFDGSKTNWATGKTLDSAGSNTGTLNSLSTTTSAVSGKVGQALKFDGANSIVLTPTDSIGTGNVTTCAWFYPRSLGETVFGRLFDSGQFQLLMNSPDLLRATSDGGTTAIDSNSMGAFNVWHHVCFTRTAAGLSSFYIDGALSGAANRSSGTPLAGSAVTLGNRSALDRTFDGLLDDMRIYNRILSAQEIANLYNSTAANVGASSMGSTTVPLGSGLIGYWTLDGSKTNWATGKSLDSSGLGNNGTLIALSTSSSPVAGKVGQAFNFNGGNYIDMGDQAVHKPTSAISFGGWVKWNRFQNSNSGFGIISKGNAGATAGFALYENTGAPFNKARAYVFASSLVAINSTQLLNTNQWYHIFVTYDGAMMRMYVDGFEDATSTLTGAINWTGVGSLWVGRGYAGAFHDGPIDDMRVYNRALSAAEIQQLYNMAR